MDKSEKMYRVVEAWQRSGIGKHKYAEKIGMGNSTLQYWCKKYKEQHTSTRHPTLGTPSQFHHRLH